MHRYLAAMLAAALAGAAVAQGADRPSPLDPQAKVPAIEYRSAFSGYRPLADPDISDWRKANEKVSKPAKAVEKTGHEGHHK